MSESDTDDFVSRRRPRTISQLTQQQLQHKRDLDRKAQRALRQRTKTRIQDLEDGYERLKASNAEKEAELLEELQKLREQNRLLKNRLESISKLAADGGPVPITVVNDPRDVTILDAGEDVTVNLDGPSSSILVGSIEFLEQPPMEQEEGHQRSHSLAVPEVQHGDSNDHLNYLDLQIPQNQVATNQDLYIRERDHTSSRVLSGSRPASVHGGAIYSADVVSGNTPSPVQTIHSEVVSPSIVRDQYLDVRASTENEASARSPTSPGSTATTQASYYRGFSSHISSVSSILSRHVPPTCPLDQILLDFLSSRRTLAAGGTPIETLLGPEQPSVSAMLNPELTATSHPVSRVMAEVLSTFPEVELPERVSFMYLMHGTMRWQMSPTKENYMRLPQWLCPTASQITTPHAAWLDNIPWPRVRDLLIEDPQKYSFQPFSEVYSQNVRVNWPFDAMDAVITTTVGQRSEVMLNPLFEKHIRKLSNWTVSRYFEMQFPELTAAIYARD